MTMKSLGAVLLVVLALATTDARVNLRRGLAAEEKYDVAGKHPYLFLSVPRGRSGPIVQGFEVIEDKDDDELSSDDDMLEAADDDDNDDDDDFDGASFKAILSDDDLDYDDDLTADNDNEKGSEQNFQEEEEEDEEKEGEEVADKKKGSKNEKKNSPMQMMDIKKATPMGSNLQSILQNVKPTQMMVSKEHAGAIMVPDGVIEIEGHTVIDEKTGKAALLVPRSALESIPDGSVVALMERSVDDATENEEERANRVIVRRRRLGLRRNVRRGTNANKTRSSSRNRNQRRRLSTKGNRNQYQQRRRLNRRKNVRAQNVRPSKSSRRRQFYRPRAFSPYVYQI